MYPVDENRTVELGLVPCPGVSIWDPERKTLLVVRRKNLGEETGDRQGDKGDDNFPNPVLS